MSGHGAGRIDPANEKVALLIAVQIAYALGAIAITFSLIGLSWPTAVHPL